MLRLPRLVAPLSAVTLIAVAGLAGCSTPAEDETTSAAPTAPATSGATPVSLTYSVAGLHCDGCVAGVNETVAAIPGVSGCDISLEEGRMIVQVDSPETGVVVADAVRRMNYTVAPLPSGADAPTEG